MPSILGDQLGTARCRASARPRVLSSAPPEEAQTQSSCHLPSCHERDAMGVPLPPAPHPHEPAWPQVGKTALLALELAS